MAKLTAETYTDAELLALCRQAVAELTVAQSTTLRGKTVTRASLPQIWATIEKLEKRLDAAAGTGGIVVVKTAHARRTGRSCG